MRRLKRKYWLWGLLLVIPPLFLLLTEVVFFFPFTYWSLDVHTKTGLVSEKNEITLLLVGDIMLDETARASVTSFGYDYPFTKTAHIIRSADFAIGNLEGPVTAVCKKNPRKNWSYQVHPDSVAGLKSAGFDAMVLANNHMRDCGDPGIIESISHLQKGGIAPFGGGLTEAQAHAPHIVKIKGVTVGFLAYLAPYIYLKGRKFSYYPYAVSARQGGGAYGTRKNLARDIRALRQKVDVLVTIFHVGDRYLEHLRPEHVELLHHAVDLGADAVVCHGTHIAGPMGSYRGRPVLQGIGNFAFGSVNPFATFGLMAILHVDRQKKRITRVQAIPVYTNNLNPLVNHRPLVLKGYMARRFLTGLKKSSAPYGSTLRRDGNRIWWDALVSPTPL